MQGFYASVNAVIHCISNFKTSLGFVLHYISLGAQYKPEIYRLAASSSKHQQAWISQCYFTSWPNH